MSSLNCLDYVPLPKLYLTLNTYIYTFPLLPYMNSYLLNDSTTIFIVETLKIQILYFHNDKLIIKHLYVNYTKIIGFDCRNTYLFSGNVVKLRTGLLKITMDTPQEIHVNSLDRKHKVGIFHRIH